MSETITDAILKRQLKISRFIVGMIGRVQAGLVTGDKQLITLIRDFTDGATDKDLASISKAGYGSRRGRQLITDIVALIDTQAATLSDLIESEVSDIADSESRFIAGVVKIKPVAINKGLTTVAGNSIRDMVNGLFIRFQGRVLSALSDAFSTGNNPVAAVRGTKSANYKDGVIVKRNNDVNSVADYAAMGVITNTRDNAYLNAKVQKVDWLATLDLRACPTCANHEMGSPYDINKAPSLPHPRCRCVKIPHYTKSSTRPFVKDDRPVKDIPKTEREGKIGQTTKKFGAWFDGLSEADKRKWLGAGRYDLYKQGKLSLADLTAGNGRILTIKELEE